MDFITHDDPRAEESERSFCFLFTADSGTLVARLAPTGGPLNYLKPPHSQGTLNTLWFSPA